MPDCDDLPGSVRAIGSLARDLMADVDGRRSATAPASACAVLAVLGRLRITAITASYVEAKVSSVRPGGAAYRVRCGLGTRWACSCPAATYGRRGDPCKHALALRAVAGALPDVLKGDWT